MKYYENFLGFRFGEYHSRDLGLYRVSDGDRYNDVSIPTFSDTTSKIPGGDGTYYWDSFYNQRTFTINTAFDNLSEMQLRQIRQIFNGKAEDWLIFDEVPYKKYRVKVQSPPQIKYHSFREDPVYDEEWNRTFERPRVYKGEIVFQFVSYYPYGIDNFKKVAFSTEPAPVDITLDCYTFTTTRDISVLASVSSAATSTVSTISSGSSVAIPTEYMAPFASATDSQSLQIYDLTMIYENNLYQLGSSGHRVCTANLVINGEAKQVTLSTTSSGSSSAFANIESITVAPSSSSYYAGTKKRDVWNNLGKIDSFKYNKNPWHYYKKQGNLYIPNTAYDSTVDYYTPSLNLEGKLWNSYKNADEWQDSAQLLSDIRFDALTAAGEQSDGAGYFIYNPGDLPTDVQIAIRTTALGTEIPSNKLQVILKRKSEDRLSEKIIESLYLNLGPNEVQSGDTHIIIDTAKNLVYGADADGNPTGTLYNKYITSGKFFKLPVTQPPLIGVDTRLVDYCDYLWINIPKTNNIRLMFDYLYY